MEVCTLKLHLKGEELASAAFWPAPCPHAGPPQSVLVGFHINPLLSRFFQEIVRNRFIVKDCFIWKMENICKGFKKKRKAKEVQWIIFAVSPPIYVRILLKVPWVWSSSTFIMKLPLEWVESGLKFPLKAKKRKTFPWRAKSDHLPPFSPSAVLWQAEPARLSGPVPLWIQAVLLLQPPQRLILLQVPQPAGWTEPENPPERLCIFSSCLQHIEKKPLKEQIYPTSALNALNVL